MHSERLRYRPVDEGDAHALLRLVSDAHVKRYLFDGETMGRDWCVDAIETSRRSFENHGLGLCLVFLADGEVPVGFCGYWVFEELGPELQLLFAFTSEHAGNGYATETAHALVDAGRAAGMSQIVSAVDEPNTASIRVLEKVGFEPAGGAPGAFGRTLLFRLRP